MTKFIAALFLAPLLLAPAMAAPAEQARIDQAVKAYADKEAADTARDIAERIAARADALNADPASPVIGNSHAPVTIVEFFDYACPYCKAVEPRLKSAIKSGKARLVLKEFPILTPASMVATRVSLAANKQGKYTAFHQALMNYRGQLDNDAIFDTAKHAGLDMVRLRKDMNATDVTDEIIADFNLARGVRIFQTPGFIVGGHLLSSESASIDFTKEIARARS